jgi:hypothetical protein
VNAQPSTARRPRRRLPAAALGATALVLEAAAGAGDPLAAGELWSFPAPPSAPWIPRDVAWAGGDSLVFAGRSYGQPGLTLLGASTAAAAPELASDGDWALALAPLEVEAVGTALFALGQFDVGGGQRRARLVRRAPATGLLAGGFTVDLPFTAAGGARLVAAEQTLAVAELFPTPGAVRVTWFDPHTGAVQRTTTLPGNGLRDFLASESGAHLALLAGTELFVLDSESGAVSFSRSFAQPPRALGLSLDGTALALGFGGRLELWRAPAAGGSFALAATIPGGATELAVALDLDRHGEFLAVGWWDGQTGRHVRLETWSVPAAAPPQRTNHWPLTGVPGGPQNYVSAVRVDPAGQRAAFGTWGQGGPEPELLLLQRGAAEPLLAADLPGSVLALDLSADGEQVAVARRQGHANYVGSLGAVELLSSGERDLALEGVPLGGGQVGIRLAAPQAVAAWILFGAPSAQPLAFTGIAGAAGLELSAPWGLVPAAPTAPGQFRVEFPVPPAATGLGCALQGLALDFAAGVPTATFGSTVLAATVL